MAGSRKILNLGSLQSNDSVTHLQAGGYLRNRAFEETPRTCSELGLFKILGQGCSSHELAVNACGKEWWRLAARPVRFTLRRPIVQWFPGDPTFQSKDGSGDGAAHGLVARRNWRRKIGQAR